MGDCESWALACEESTLGYHPECTGILTAHRDPVAGHCQVGSLTGAVASQTVTEARKGSLSAVGNRASSVKAEASLTARQTSRAGSKDGLSDPVVPSGRAIAQRIKAGAVVGPKGWAVRPLKRYVSWVQNVVRQFGPYLPWAQEI